MSRHRRRTGKKSLGFQARGNSWYSDRLGVIAPERRPSRPTTRSDHERGPTGEQQRELAALCRLHGIEYPSPITAAEADAHIARLAALGHDHRDRARGPTGQQQKELAALCRQHGISYPAPRTAADAVAAIARLRGGA